VVEIKEWAVENKTPLLRSMEAINKQALRILRLSGNVSAKCVVPMAGPEQRELAPVCTTANIAADHNRLTIELIHLSKIYGRENCA